MKFSGLVVLLITLTGGLQAQTPPPAPAEARQFDFWLGQWDVFNPDGSKAGESRIEKISDGWGLLENWSGDGGSSGKSLNTWIPRLKQWRQFWVGQGGSLDLSGGLNDRGEMILEGRVTGRDGKVHVNRITWTPHADGTVRQRWVQSADAGTTWTMAFDGIYRRKS